MTAAWVGGRGAWWQEWGTLALLAVIALPLFTPRIYASDEIKYFATLRSVYFDGDIDYANEYSYFVARDPVAHAGLAAFAEIVTPTGYRLNDAPIGTAVLWAPFYVAADLGVVVARSFGSAVPRDGFAWPYIWAVCIASLFWGTVGLILMYRLCRTYAGRTASTWSVLGIWFASPVVFYIYITPAMAHANSLFAATLFLLLWQTNRPDHTVARWILLGCAAGLMVLVRELNWVFVLAVAAGEAWSLFEVMKARSEERRIPAGRALFEEVRQRAGRYLAFGLTLSAIVAPQFYVYQTLNASLGPTPFVVAKFSAFPRHVVPVLFSGFHGLFSWHPVTLLGVAGLGILWRRERRLTTVLVLLFVSQVLIVGSYSTWWGGTGFGARRFMNCSPIFAVGLAAALASFNIKAQRLAGIALVLLVLWNFGLAVQYSVGLIPRDAPVRMSQIAYNQIFEVPPRIGEIAWRFAFERSSLYRTKS